MLSMDFDETQSRFIIGTCDSMCPKSEMTLRERERLLHAFEVLSGTEKDRRPKADPNKVVKCYKRSAAGLEPTPSDLRPYPVLMKTVQYLFDSIFPMHKDKPVAVYQFMFDRLRSVRQDMVIQNLSPFETIALLEPIARFHMYFGYILIEENESNFDPYINNTHLQECLKRLLVCYDQCENCSFDLSEEIKKLSIDSSVHLRNRCNIEGAYLLLNLGHVEALTRGVKISEKFINHEILSLSFAWYQKNYVRVLHLLQCLSPLLLCAALISIPDIRKYCLQVMSCAYSCSNCCYPISHLTKLLLYENDTQLIDDCQYLYIKVSGSNVNFSKSCFNYSAKSLKSRRLLWVDKKLMNCNLIKLLSCGDE